MTWTVARLTGSEGELIERFCYCLHDVVVHGGETVENVLPQVALAIGAAIVRAELEARDYDATERHIAQRGLALVDEGVSEAFLIRALLAHVGDELVRGTEVEKINRKRAETLDAIGHDLSPGAVSTLQPLTPDEVAASWVARDRWVATTGEVLSDELIEAWASQRWVTLARRTMPDGPSHSA